MIFKKMILKICSLRPCESYASILLVGETRKQLKLLDRVTQRVEKIKLF